MERATRAAADLRKLVTETVGEEDADLIRDTVEGETDIVDAIRDTVEAVFVLNAQIEGVKRHVDRMEDRVARMEAKATRLRGLIHQAMATAEIDTLPLDIATLTRKPAGRTVIVTDEALIPARFWKPSDPKLDKRALADALKDGGETILGAELSNGGETLQIRSK
jgi:predicted phage tail protein